MTSQPSAAESADPLPGLERFVDAVIASSSLRQIAGVQIALVKEERVLSSARA
jgi:hypothetical protein